MKKYYKCIVIDAQICLSVLREHFLSLPNANGLFIFYRSKNGTFIAQGFVINKAGIKGKPQSLLAQAAAARVGGSHHSSSTHHPAPIAEVPETGGQAGKHNKLIIIKCL